MGESSIKSGRKRGYVVLFRSAAQDQRLTLAARGLLAMMISLPENWEYTVAGLAVKAGCGREQVRRLLRELQTVGYLIREQSHDSVGRFGGAVYVLQDEAPLPGNPDNGEEEKLPLPENPSTGKPSTEEPSTEIRPQKNKDQKKPEEKKPPKAPQGGRRSGRYELTEEAKNLLRAYVGEDKELHRTLGAFMDLRKDLRAVNSGRAVKLLLARLDEYSGGSRENKLALINQSIVNSWKGVFPLRWAADQGKPTAPAEPPAPRPYHLEMIDGEEVVVYDG